MWKVKTGKIRNFIEFVNFLEEIFFFHFNVIDFAEIECDIVLMYSMTMTHDLLRIVPSEIPRPSKYGKSYLAKGDFVYFHYCCDNINDVVSTWNDSDGKWKQIFKKKTYFRVGDVPTGHFNRCVHGSQNIAWIIRMVSMKLISRPSKIFNKPLSISTTNHLNFYTQPIGLVH